MSASFRRAASSAVTASASAAVGPMAKGLRFHSQAMTACTRPPVIAACATAQRRASFEWFDPSTPTTISGSMVRSLTVVPLASPE